MQQGFGKEARVKKGRPIWKNQQGMSIDLDEFDVDEDGIPFEEIYNYDGDINKIKEGVILFDEELGTECFKTLQQIM